MTRVATLRLLCSVILLLLTAAGGGAATPRASSQDPARAADPQKPIASLTIHATDNPAEGEIRRQTGSGELQAPPAAPEPIAWTTNWFYEDAKSNFLAAAELMPAEDYRFMPAADVRTFGQIVGHIANWQFTNCAAARGEPNPNRKDFEKSETKAEIVEGIRAAYTYCDEVFKSLDLDRLSAGSRGSSVMFRAMSALAHPYLHYGNLITYLRLKGIVPPSTARRGGR